MAAEEFQESEVIFPDYTSDIHATHHREHDDDDGGGHFDHRAGFSRNGSVSLRKNTETTKKKVATGSLPVNIPRHHYGSVFHCGEDFEEDEEEEGEIVPPHVILGRRIAGKMAFSVCTGNGRTLKGRDLSQVRNLILRMTGFLEP
ncbi:Pentatricopeptide repeat superfamily protein [Hibiscus syriacus]|uniref:Pentatricopeptide repeat superfamily protein n=1 Tax=Hibiscus syriacus TaxID=106335 RepID=A0A6A3BWQ1_HIBSY|nr:uncharacterized protein LOC120210444 [Hibiscus syriacus]KAE8719878.1 Pentatricopeptide repeat superfamily protein [Hibiscus syriacus]